MNKVYFEGRERGGVSRVFVLCVCVCVCVCGLFVRDVRIYRDDEGRTATREEKRREEKRGSTIFVTEHTLSLAYHGISQENTRRGTPRRSSRNKENNRCVLMFFVPMLRCTHRCFLAYSSFIVSLVLEHTEQR